jgi:hypothetical protein
VPGTAIRNLLIPESPNRRAWHCDFSIINSRIDLGRSSQTHAAVYKHYHTDGVRYLPCQLPMPKSGQCPNVGAPKAAATSLQNLANRQPLLRLSSIYTPAKTLATTLP